LGQPKNPAAYGKARKALAALARPEDEPTLKSGRTYGAIAAQAPALHAEHFGPVIVTCDRADLRLTAKGVEIWGDFKRDFIAAPPDPTPRAPVLKALHDAIRHNRPPLQSGGWGRASLELCHAILDSARTGGFVALTRQ
jgi:phthalate 4,5-cis-dihydrodiol dehydrogenase